MTKILKKTAYAGVAILAVCLMASCASSPSMTDSVASEPAASTGPDLSFDSLKAGTQIDMADSSWSVEKVDGVTMLANVSSDMALSAPNSLYLFDNATDNKPYALINFADGAAAAGSVSFAAYIPSSNPKTVYVNFGVGKNNSDRYFELRLQADSNVLQYENGSEDPNVAEITTDAWHTYTVDWADGMFSISVDGVPCPDATNVSVESTGLMTSNIPTTVTFYVGDTKSTGTAAYIDDIKSDLF